MANIVQIGDLYTFSNTPTQDGVLMTGSYYTGNSLSYDELSIDTLTFTVRYFGEDDLSDYKYGTPVTYTKDGRLVGKYYLEKVSQTFTNEYQFDCISAIGLLDGVNHYGGLYKGELAGDIIDDIIGNTIQYSVRQIFYKIKIYGWLPVATKRENLKQILFACGGVIKKDSNGNPYVTVLENTVPTEIPTKRLSDGRITFDKKATKANITEHSFAKVDSVEEESLFDGEMTGNNFTTPKGYDVTNAGIVVFDEPCHSIRVEGTEILNDEIGVNYVVIKSSPVAKVYGKKYVHAKNIIYRNNDDVSPNNGESTIKVEDATLVSLANSSSVGARALAYYGYANTVDQGIWLNEEKTGDFIHFTNPWGKEVTGFIKELDCDMGNTENYGDAVIMSNYTPLTIQASHDLVSIAVTNPPNKVVYEAGESFDPTGMIITATYDDGETANVSNYTYSPAGALGVEDTTITINYIELGISASTTVSVQVKVLVKRIAVTSPPNRVVYQVGESFDPTGMVITAYYSDNSNKTVDNYTYSPTGALSEQNNSIEIKYVEDGIEVTTYQPIAVGSDYKPITIVVTKQPNKTKYQVGESFDPAGMICQVILSDGDQQVIYDDAKGYTYSPNGPLTTQDTKITISYTFNNVTVSTNINIEVVALNSIAVTKQPSKTKYYEDEYFDPKGMEITAYYSDGSSNIVNNYTYQPNTPLPYGLTEVTIIYQDKTTTVAIEVDYYAYDFTHSIVISETSNFTLQSIGATHKNIRVIVIGGGQGGTGGVNGEAGGDGARQSSSSGMQSIGNPGLGGAGGSGSSGGQPGKVYFKDVYLPSLTTPINVQIGAGGNGSTGAKEPTEGLIGADTVFSANAESINSADGSVSQTGFTDIFTQQTYALPGGSGLAGGNGGDGGEGDLSSGQVGNKASDISGATGGAGGNPKAWSGGSVVDHWNDILGTQQRVTIASGTTRTGYTSYSFNSQTGTYNLTGYKSVVIKPGNIGNQQLYNYISQQKIEYTSYGMGDFGDEILYGFYNTRTAQYVMTQSYRRVVSGGGGGGATPGVNGEQGQLIDPSSTDQSLYGLGGAGANASPQPQASVYGSGGQGGNGGGGGGGAGACSIVTHNNQTSSLSIGPISGGAGGIGGTGGQGGNGCIIIYYS